MRKKVCYYLLVQITKIVRIEFRVFWKVEVVLSVGLVFAKFLR